MCEQFMQPNGTVAYFAICVLADSGGGCGMRFSPDYLQVKSQAQ